MTNRWGKYNLTVFFGLILLMNSLPASAGPVKEVSYLFKLSTFTGTADVGSWPFVREDCANNEIYVLSPEDIRVFNQNGMQLHQISLLDDDGELMRRRIMDVAVKKNGDIVFMIQSYDSGKLIASYEVANFRGDPISRIVLTNLPPHLADFQADRIFSRDGNLYLANLYDIRIVVVNEEGSYQRDYEIKPLVQKYVNEEREKTRSKKSREIEDTDLEMGDFSVDHEGNIVFTVPVSGYAFKLTPDLRLFLISRRGSGAGKFGIPSSITVDSKGNYLVSDLLRHAVMIFDKDLNYIDEFGGRYKGDFSIIAPRNIIIDKNDRIYVSQTDGMGVSVFQLGY